MRAGGVTFLLSLALIHVSWAGNSANEIEEVPAEDGVVHKAGYVFNDDKIFAEKVNSVMKCSADAMKNFTTKNSRFYAYCQRIDYDSYCIYVSLDNITYLSEKFGNVLPLPHNTTVVAGYHIETNKALMEQVDSLFLYTFKVLNQSASRNSSYFSYCKKVGDDVVCLTGTLMKYLGLLNEEKLDSSEDPMFLKQGYIFDDDKIFAEKSGSLLNYTREIMRSCTTRDSRDYLICNRVNEEITCLHVWFVKGVNEFLDNLYFGLYGEPKDVHQRDYEDFHFGELGKLLKLEDNNELLEREHNREIFEREENNAFKTPSKENIEE